MNPQIDNKIGRTAVAAVRAAGKVIRENRNKVYRIKHKGTVDLVTEIDEMAEKLIVTIIGDNFPSHQIVAEESGIKEKDSDYIWYVDPLDGTTNYAHGYPHCSVSVALEYRGELVLGYVLDPMRDELFSAAKGAGAFLNGKKIRVSTAEKLEECLLATGFPYDLALRPYALSLVERLLGRVQGIRRDGSAALNLSYTAAGRLDGYWETTLKPWDCAAGALLVTEAGGIVSNFRGGDFNIHKPEVVAGNPYIHPLLVRVIGQE